MCVSFFPCAPPPTPSTQSKPSTPLCRECSFTFPPYLFSLSSLLFISGPLFISVCPLFFSLLSVCRDEGRGGHVGGEGGRMSHKCFGVVCCDEHSHHGLHRLRHRTAASQHTHAHTHTGTDTHAHIAAVLALWFITLVLSHDCAISGCVCVFVCGKNGTVWSLPVLISNKHRKLWSAAQLCHFLPETLCVCLGSV